MDRHGDWIDRRSRPATSHLPEALPGTSYRDEGSIMKEAVAREISMLMEEQPGVSFEKHLAGRKKTFGKEGAMVKEILSALLREALPAATTVRFFAELASYRGFAGAVFDEAWSYLEHNHREEMYRQREANEQAQTVTRQEGVINDLQAELSAALERERDMKEEADKLRSEVSAARDRERKSAEATAELFSGLSVAHGQEKKAAEKMLAGLASKLADAHTQLDKERTNATAAAQMAEEAAEKTNAEIRAEADASVQEAQKETEGLRASLSASIATQGISARKAEDVASQLGDVRQLLAEERTATAEMEMQVKAAEGVITQHEAVTLNLQAELSEGKGEVSRLRSQLSEAAEAMEAAERESVNVRFEADVARRETEMEQRKAKDDMDACTVRADANKAETCEDQLASLPSSNDQCDCSGMEVPATADGGSDSTSGAPTPPPAPRPPPLDRAPE